MNVDQAKDAAKKTGLGLSAAAVVWMFATFARDRDVQELKSIMKDVQEQVHSIDTKVTVLDAIRRNEQEHERQRYE